MSNQEKEAQEQELYRKERRQFRQLLLQNPNFFGNLKGSKLEPILQIQGNKAYEEIGCVGFQPDINQLRAVIYIKQPVGYGGGICSAGSTEYVRFYLSFDGGLSWQDQGSTSFTAYNIPEGTKGAKRLEYAVTQEAEAARRICLFPNLIQARAILSWNQEPPPNQPGWTPVWGDVHNTHIQIDPLKFFVIDEVFKAADFNLPPKFAEVVDLSQEVSAPPPKQLSMNELQKLYANEDVEPHRFAMAEAQKLVSQPGTISALVASGQPSAFPGLNFDISEVFKALSEPTGNTSYEELECVGLDQALSELVATFRIKRGSGYSGGQCTAGSTEYVTFWADTDLDGNFETAECLGTASVQVYDYGRKVPEDGLEYAVSLPFDVNRFRRPCQQGPKLLRIRATLSWNKVHKCNKANQAPVWGNAEDTVVHIPAGDREQGDFHPFLDTVSTVDVCSIDQGTGYATGQRPFGARLNIGGEIPVAVLKAENRFKYKVQVRPLNSVGNPIGPWQPLNNTFWIKVREGFVPGFANIYSIKQEIDGNGYYTYREYGSAAGFPYRRVISPHRLLVPWITTSSQTGLWEIKIKGLDTFTSIQYQAGISTCVDSTTRQNVKVFLDQKPPKAEVEITGFSRGGGPVQPAQDCGTFQVGDVIHGAYSATDQHFRILTLAVEPTDAANGATVNPSVRAYPVVPTAGEAGTWTLNTGPMDPCGYVVRLQVWDRTIVSGNSSGWKDVDSVGFCLDEPPQ